MARDLCRGCPERERSRRVMGAANYTVSGAAAKSACTDPASRGRSMLWCVQDPRQYRLL